MLVILWASLALTIGMSLSILQQDPLATVVHTLANLTVQALQIFILPIVFFGLIARIREVVRSRILRTHAWLLAGQSCITIALAALGVLSVLAISPERIPIIIVDPSTVSAPIFVEDLQQVLPTNIFASLAADGALLLPVYLIGLVIGLIISNDHTSRVIIDLTDALSRLFYRINSFITNYFWTLILICGASLAATLTTSRVQPYGQLLMVLAIDFGLVVGLLLLGWRTLERKRPTIPYLSRLIMPVMTAFVTGHHHAALAAMTRYGTKELQVSESLNSMAFPFFALFGRAGSTMVASATFTAIILSYSNISLAAVDVLWIIGTASITAFALGAAPGGGVTAALAILAMSYRDSLKESYLVVEPILPLLIALGAAADVLISGALVLAIDTRHRLLVDR